MITFDIEGRYEKLIIVDGKSYVMLDYDGNIVIKGNTLRSRSTEPIFNTMLYNCCWHVLNEEPEKIRDEYDRVKDKIESKTVSVEEILKRENINMSLEEYRIKVASGNPPIAVYEAALSSDRVYSKGDVINTWIEEPEPVLKEYKTKPNEWVVPKGISSYLQIRNESEFNGNIYVHHYLDKLDNAIRSLIVVLGLEKFREMFPEISIRKPEQIKLIPVMGLERFNEEFPEFKWNDKALEKIPNNEGTDFYIEDGKLINNNQTYNT